MPDGLIPTGGKHSGYQVSKYSGARLGLEKLTAILKAYDAGQSVSDIAKQVNSDRRTVGGVLRQYRDRVTSAQALMAASTLDMVHAWQAAVPIASARGDHRPAKEYLQAVGAIQGPNSAATGGIGAGPGGVNVQVVIGMPGAPIPHDPLANLKPIK